MAAQPPSEGLLGTSDFSHGFLLPQYGVLEPDARPCVLVCASCQERVRGQREIVEQIHATTVQPETRRVSARAEREDLCGADLSQTGRNLGYAGGMERERLRLLGLLLGCLALVIGAMFVMSWFVASVSGLMELRIGLRSVEVCGELGPCVSTSLSNVRGFYTTLSSIIFWGSIAFALLVLFQGGSKLLTGYAAPSLSRAGYLPGAALVMLAAAAAYLFGPEVGGMDIEMVRVEVERTFAPLMMIVGLCLGIAVLHMSTVESSDDVGAVRPVSLPPARALTLATPPAVVLRPRHHPHRPQHPHPRRTSGASSPTRSPAASSRRSASTRGARAAKPSSCCGATSSASWSGGCLASSRRRCSSTSCRDPGSTLRVLPWTRLTGAATMGGDDASVRALIAKLRELAPEARLDGATRTFVETDAPAAQFPDLAALETHDTRIDQLGAGAQAG